MGRSEYSPLLCLFIPSIPSFKLQYRSTVNQPTMGCGTSKPSFVLPPPRQFEDTGTPSRVTDDPAYQAAAAARTATAAEASTTVKSPNPAIKKRYPVRPARQPPTILPLPGGIEVIIPEAPNSRLSSWMTPTSR